MRAGVVLTLLSTPVVLLHTTPSSPALLQLLFLCELDRRLPVLDSVFQNFILNLEHSHLGYANLMNSISIIARHRVTCSNDYA